MHTSTSTEHDHLLALHARHLIAYAEQNRDFGNLLAATIREYDWAPSALLSEATSRHLTPACPLAAERATRWILSVLTHSSEYRLTKGTLAAWANDFDQPRSVVIGIVGIAIMGPTLGILEKKKKKKSKMQLVLSERTYEALGKSDVAKLVTRLSHQQLATELKVAGGDTYALHPDTADWLLEEQQVELYVAPADRFVTLTTTAADERLPHLHLDEGEAAAMVLSPCVEDSFLAEAGLEKL